MNKEKTENVKNQLFVRLIPTHIDPNLIGLLLTGSRPRGTRLDPGP